MSWMDSWSRPSKHAITPPPYYLTQGEATPYCHTCGRLISSRKIEAASSTQPPKYCSGGCRSKKPGRLDRRIEETFVALLEGQQPSWIKEQQEAPNAANPSTDNAPQTAPPTSKPKEKFKPHKKTKGDTRRLITCDEVESVVFGSRFDPSKTSGRKKNKASRIIGSGTSEPEPEPQNKTDEEDANLTAASLTAGEDSLSDTTSADGDAAKALDADPRRAALTVDNATAYMGGKIRPPQEKSDVNGSVGGEKGRAEREDETEENKRKREEGARKAEEREMVKRAARRGVVFGFVEEGGKVRRKCEAVMNAAVVEPSFAKGEWGIRWREKE
ncbi:hypothetical protein M501DRAFT_937700 [Patellaria atrata CBS 101060]|uniref:Uncharacterized protein n=1 Tax=Patellaria atrata CBS 101060 TaxID=1346257 RepID=A0A9P4S8Z7_9PEZI|nr:hypothetical protein M501DRAFT_937700 [Patellaria atrata CBS 101060]